MGGSLGAHPLPESGTTLYQNRGPPFTKIGGHPLPESGATLYHNLWTPLKFDLSHLQSEGCHFFTMAASSGLLTVAITYTTIQ